jgi:hypothetical protein
MSLIQPISKAVQSAPASAATTGPTNTLNAQWEYMTMSYTYSYGSTTYEINGEKAGKYKNIPLHDVLTIFGQSGWELVGMGGPEGKTYVLTRQGVRDVSVDKPEK